MAEDNPFENFTVTLHQEVKNDNLLFHVYSPFWLINRTGLELIMKVY